MPEVTAFFKPYIGMITGLFIISALAVGIGEMKDVALAPRSPADLAASPPVWPSLKEYYFHYAVGFLAGFSERLTMDFVEMAEDRFGGRSRSSGARSTGGG